MKHLSGNMFTLTFFNDYGITLLLQLKFYTHELHNICHLAINTNLYNIEDKLDRLIKTMNHICSWGHMSIICGDW